MIKRLFTLQFFLFISFTFISALPVFLLAMWVQRTATTKELAAVREKHLVIARNLSAAFARYVRDTETTFRHMVSDLSPNHSMSGIGPLLKRQHIESVSIYDANFTR